MATLVEYRDSMEFPMELLAQALCDLSVINEGAGMPDHELVTVATRKLRVMHKMLLAAGVSESMLKAVMEE